MTRADRMRGGEKEERSVKSPTLGAIRTRRYRRRLRTGSRPMVAEAPAELIDRLIGGGWLNEADICNPRAVGDAFLRAVETTV